MGVGIAVVEVEIFRPDEFDAEDNEEVGAGAAPAASAAAKASTSGRRTARGRRRRNEEFMATKGEAAKRRREQSLSDFAAAESRPYPALPATDPAQGARSRKRPAAVLQESLVFLPVKMSINRVPSSLSHLPVKFQWKVEVSIGPEPHDFSSAR